MTADSSDYLTAMRGMLAIARIQFREMAEPLIDGQATQDFADSLEAAIGEISADEAIEALKRWKAKDKTCT